jgi:hypothetical protein
VAIGRLMNPSEMFMPITQYQLLNPNYPTTRLSNHPIDYAVAGLADATAIFRVLNAVAM